jgi:hypothetical protein
MNIGLEILSLVCIAIALVYNIFHTVDMIDLKRYTKWNTLWALVITCCLAIAFAIGICKLF